MKYTVHGLQQEKLIEMGLDNDDALILSVIKEMYSSKKMEYQIIDGERFIWIDQGHLLEQIPIIGAQRSLKRRLKKLDEMKIIERRVVFEKDGVKGKFSYINITSKLDYLSEYIPWDKMSQGLGQSVPRVGTKCPNKDTPIRDSINNISKDILSSTHVQRVIEEWNSIGLQKIISINAGTNRYKSLKARINEYGIENVIKAIKNINESSFLKGQNNRNWIVNFDWLVKPNNFIKVLEGNYKDENGGKNNGSFRQDFSKGQGAKPKYDYDKINGI
ncbi:hypothetical protein [Clostridium perfringens]|uniref:hypothetical protein n=1 Tax=Clostridium perfringens TaxID=1502 RepID=UPI0022451FCF|nr:hypothetical protein [Clostridium perfringens]MCX0399173.1 hypothetical protein [Clostridium perfringens]